MKSGENWTERTFDEAEKALGYAFRDRTLLLACFTHRSYHCNFHQGVDNERLEFLGDAVLGLIVTEKLFRARREDEGGLTELRKQYVSRDALTRAEKKANLMRFLRYSGSSNNVSGKTNSNLFEAVVAGIYLDGGMEAAEAFLDRFLTEIETKNYKSLLQEFVQERTKETPSYQTEEEDGRYLCTVAALGLSASGMGESKKAAQTLAAKRLYQKLTERKNG